MNMDLDAVTKEAPTLTLDPFAEAKAEIVEKKPEELVEEQAVPEMELTPEEQKQVDDFAAQIDLTNTQAVLQYGAGSQKKIADFSETALNNVRTKDMGEVGTLLTDVVAQLKDKDLGGRLLLPTNMLRMGEDVFLDDWTLDEVEKALQVHIDIVKSSGQDLLDAIFGV